MSQTDPETGTPTAARTDEAVVDVVVEIPRGSRNKYEWDPEHQAMRFDRRLLGAIAFPADYGFVPDTEGSDGDALDALVLLQEPSYPGVRVRSRVIGVQWIGARHGREAKLLCVPEGDPEHEGVHDLADLPGYRVREIAQFFANYQELDEGATPSDEGTEGREAALTALREARERAATAA